MYRRLLLLLILIISVSLVTLAQDFSNKGREFWLAYSYHVGMASGGNRPEMTIYITSDVLTSYQVEIVGNTVVQSGTINPGQVVSVAIPYAAAIDNEGRFQNRAIHVTAARPVVVYSYITRAQASAATLCLPSAVLGKEYYSVNFTQVSNENNSHSFFTVVALEDNTTVEITPAAATRNGWAANSVHLVTLQRGEIYQVLGRLGSGFSGEDLTGSYIRSVASGAEGCKKIAVFSGSGKIRIPQGCPYQSSDNLYQQLYPLNTWGQRFLTAPAARNPNNYFRIIKANPATNVYQNGTLIPAASFVNNRFHEIFTNQPMEITADGPISMAQYFTTQECSGNGLPLDPDMIILNPLEQNIKRVTLVNSNLYANQGPPDNLLHEHYVHVIIPSTGVASFTIDNVPANPNAWQPHPAAPGYSYGRFEVARGYHLLQADSGFNALAYGFGDAESYGYSAGASVPDRYQYLTIDNHYATVDVPAGCADSPFDLLMTFPYRPTRISLDWGTALQATGLTNVDINAPVFESTSVVNGRNIYTYRLATDIRVVTPGIYPIRLTAQNPTVDGCSGDQELDYDLEIFQRPKADFNFETKGCTQEPVVFNEVNSLPDDHTIPIRYWNLADGSPVITTANPTHTYATAGNFEVEYAFQTSIGCVSDTMRKTIPIYELPAITFDITDPACAGSGISFTPTITAPTDRPITRYSWDFGDGSPVTQTTNATPATHVYPAIGTFQPALEVEFTGGCMASSDPLTMTVHARPDAGFQVPILCVQDAATPFIDTSKVAAGSIANWEWTFNDPNATPGNPNTLTGTGSAAHQFTVAGNYTVQLIAITDAGCRDTARSTVPINGDGIVPLFSFPNAGIACAGNEIVIRDASTIDAGQLIRTEILWDAIGEPNTIVTVDQPVAGTEYRHTYPHLPVERTYTILLRTWSGQTCVEEYRQDITIYPAADLLFANVAGICEDAPAINLAPVVSLLNAIPGEGSFTGTGVSPVGLFEPERAGAGSHTISYIFTSTNGCVSTSEQTIEVYPMPIADAGPDLFLLENGQLVINAALQNNINATYTWSPAIGLSSTSIERPTVGGLTADQLYTMEVVTDKGCRASDQVLVSLLKDPVIPNAFSPNGDGIHDRWVIRHLDSYQDCRVQIFNRYGQRVHQIINYSTAWDGRVNGKDLPVGVYYYIIETGIPGKRYSGSLTIIR